MCRVSMGGAREKKHEIVSSVWRSCTSSSSEGVKGSFVQEPSSFSRSGGCLFSRRQRQARLLDAFAHFLFAWCRCTCISLCSRSCFFVFAQPLFFFSPHVFCALFSLRQNFNARIVHVLFHGVGAARCGRRSVLRRAGPQPSPQRPGDVTAVLTAARRARGRCRSRERRRRRRRSPVGGVRGWSGRLGIVSCSILFSD